MSIVEQVRHALDTDKRVQKEIADAVGIDPISLSLFRHGHRGVSVKVLDRLCEVLGLEIAKRKRK